MFSLGVEVASGSGEEDGISLVCKEEDYGTLSITVIQDAEENVVLCATTGFVVSLKILTSSSDSVVSLPMSLLLHHISI